MVEEDVVVLVVEEVEVDVMTATAAQPIRKLS